jgi:hypothetical protein
MIIRSKYRTSGIVKQCQFKIDLMQSLVGVQASITISLLTINNLSSDNNNNNNNGQQQQQQWIIAIIDVEIFFCCPPIVEQSINNIDHHREPFVQLKVKNIQRLVHPSDTNRYDQITNVATFLVEMMHQSMLAGNNNHDYNNKQISNNFKIKNKNKNTNTKHKNTNTKPNFRDVFLQQTQIYVTDITIGMKSALNNIVNNNNNTIPQNNKYKYQANNDKQQC